MTTIWKTPLTKRNEELADVGLFGEGVHEEILQMVKGVREHPKYISDMDVSVLEFIKRSTDRKARRPPKPPSPLPQSNIIECFDPDYLVIVPTHLLSKFERENYYHGVSRNPSELYYRSDHESNPYPLPPPRTPFQIPIKTLHGVFDTPLNAVWNKVARMIIALLKECGINFSSLLAVRYSSCYEGGP